MNIINEVAINNVFDIFANQYLIDQLNDLYKYVEKLSNGFSTSINDEQEHLMLRQDTANLLKEFDTPTEFFKKNIIRK